MKPRLRFNYNENYSYELFKDVFQIKNNNSFSREELKAFGNFKNIHYGDIHTKLNKITNVQSTDLPYIAQENEVKLTELCNDYDVLIADASEDYSDIGKCIQLINVKNCVAGLHTILARPKYKSLYLTHLLSSWYVRKQFMKLACGAKVLGLSKSSLQKVVLPFPKLEEQNKIATFLNLYYKKIELLNKKLNLLKLRKEGFLQRVFRKQYPNIYKLNAILKERSIYSSDKQMYTHATLSKDGVFPKIERYNRDFLVKDEEKKYKITYKNDICYNPANLKFGVICLNNYGTLIFSPIYVTFEINTNLTDITYISHLLTWNETIQKLRKYEEGTVYERMAVSSEDFVKLIITLPAIQEQKNISQKILSFDKEIDLISNKINLLEKYKQGLLQKMFI